MSLGRSEQQAAVSEAILAPPLLRLPTALVGLQPLGLRAPRRAVRRRRHDRLAAPARVSAAVRTGTRSSVAARALVFVAVVKLGAVSQICDGAEDILARHPLVQLVRDPARPVAPRVPDSAGITMCPSDIEENQYSKELSI